MSEWKEVILEDIIEDISMGPFGSDIKRECYVPYGMPYLNGSNVQGIKLGEDSFIYVPDEKARKLKKSIAHRGDIIVTHRGTIGQIVYVPENSKYEEYLVSNSQFRVSFNKKKVDPVFLAYYFHSRIGQYKILANASQVGVPALSRPTSTFRKITVHIPSELEEQQRIASILSSLDDKIAVNRRICENLEAQAQALFKHWFIDFAPFKDGKFVESELGMIPEGWRVGTLGEIADINPTRSLKKGLSATYLDMKNMPTSGSFPASWEQKNYEGGMKFKNGDTLMARITPCLENGKVAYVDFLKEDEIGFGSTEYIVMTAKDVIFPELLYTLCRFPSFVSYATKNMNGSSGRQRVSGETIANFKMAIAPDIVYAGLKPLFYDCMKKIRECGFENIRLSLLRDTLLPKLMSGEIKV